MNTTRHASAEQKKWQAYFRRFGCLICETKRRRHAGNGMCRLCRASTLQSLARTHREVVATASRSARLVTR